MNRLVKTNEYIEKVNEADPQRAGHHRAVVERHVLNLVKPLDQQSEYETKCVDNYLVKRLHNLDIPVSDR